MRLTGLVSASLLLSGLGIAQPTVSEVKDLGKSPVPRDNSANELFARDGDCGVVNTVVEVVGTSSAAVIYASFGGLTALYVCRRMSGQECDVLASAVAAGFMSVFTLLHQTGAISPRDGEPLSISDLFSQHFEDNGIEYQAVTDSTEEVLSIFDENARNPERKPKSVTSLHGVKHNDNPPVNMDVYDFGDGEGHIHLPHDMFEDRSKTGIHNRDLTKREDGPGFKLAFTSGIPTQLTRTHQADISLGIANWWATMVDNYDMHDVIGFVETGESANFYFRLIPEASDFGLNYESVDVCGEMSDYL